MGTTINRKRTIALVLVLVTAAEVVVPYAASAMSVPDFEQQTIAQKADFIKQYVQQKIDGIRSSDPQRAAALENYFIVASENSGTSPGMAQVSGRIGNVQLLGQEGRLDPSKIQVERILNYVIREMPK